MNEATAEQHHPGCDSRDAQTCPCYAPRRPIPVATEDPEREAIALTITCPDCHAPMDVRCVAQMWTCSSGQWKPYCIPRHAHSRRVKAARRFRAPDLAAETQEKAT